MQSITTTVNTSFRFQIFRNFLISIYSVYYVGPGANTSQRVSDHILTDAQAKDFTIEKVFLETPQWIDFTYEH